MFFIAWASPMPAINAVYSRNNLTMFSTSIVQASRGLPKQALNAVYSQLYHFRTTLSAINKLCRFAEVPPPYFFLFFITVFTFYVISFLFSVIYTCICLSIKPFTSISRRITVDVVETFVAPCCSMIAEAVQQLTATTNWAPAVHCRGLPAVAWCRVGSWTSFLVSL